MACFAGSNEQGQFVNGLSGVAHFTICGGLQLGEQGRNPTSSEWGHLVVLTPPWRPHEVRLMTEAPARAGGSALLRSDCAANELKPMRPRWRRW
jgi:hypothetical protein